MTQHDACVVVEQPEIRFKAKLVLSLKHLEAQTVGEGDVSAAVRKISGVQRVKVTNLGRGVIVVQCTLRPGITDVDSIRVSVKNALSALLNQEALRESQL